MKLQLLKGAYRSLEAVKDSRDYCFQRSNLFLLYRQYRKKINQNNKINLNQSAEAKSLPQTCFFQGFIKSANLRPYDQLTINHRTNDSLNQQSYLKDLTIENIFVKIFVKFSCWTSIYLLNKTKVTKSIQLFLSFLFQQ